MNNSTRKRFQRGLCAWLFCAFLLVLLPLNGKSENVGTSILSGDDMGFLLDACTINGEVYVLSTLGIYHIDMAHLNDAPKKIVDLSMIQRGILTPEAPLSKYEKELWDQGIGYLFALDNVLYGMHPYTGQISMLQGPDMVSITKIPEEQLFYTDQGEVQRKEIINVFGAEGRLYTVLKSFTYEKGNDWQLYSWDLETEAVLLPGIEGLQAAVPGAAGTLMVYAKDKAEDHQAWMLYDLAKQTIGEVLLDSTEATFGLALNPGSNHLYYVNASGMITEVSSDNSRIQRAFVSVAQPKLTDRAIFVNTDHYLYVCKNGLYIRDVSSTVATTRPQLQIMGQIDRRLINLYSAQHPEVTVVVADRVSSHLQFQESIISRDSSIDIYIINTAQFYNDVREKGYADTLDTSKKLQELSMQLYPPIRDALYHDGHLVAYPLSITPNSWAINRSVWEKLNTGSYPSTYNELFQKAQKWEENYADVYPEYTFMQRSGGLVTFLSSIVYQYLLENETSAEAVSFNTDAFRTAVESALQHKEILNGADDNLTPLIVPYRQQYGVGYQDEDEVIAILPPALDDGAPRMCGATMELMIVNPLSENKSLAIEFIAFCADNINVEMQYVLYATKTEPVKPPHHEEDLQAMLAKIEDIERRMRNADGPEKMQLQGLIDFEKSRYELNVENGWLISPDWIDVYKGIAEQLVIPVQSIFFNDPFSTRDESIMSTLKVFADGSMSIDMLVDQLNSIARLQFSENR